MGTRGLFCFCLLWTAALYLKELPNRFLCTVREKNILVEWPFSQAALCRFFITALVLSLIAKKTTLFFFKISVFSQSFLKAVKQIKKQPGTLINDAQLESSALQRQQLYHRNQASLCFTWSDSAAMLTYRSKNRKWNNTSDIYFLCHIVMGKKKRK